MYVPVHLETNEPARLVSGTKFSYTFITHDGRRLTLIDETAEADARSKAIAERKRLNGRSKADH